MENYLPNDKKLCEHMILKPYLVKNNNGCCGHIMKVGVYCKKKNAYLHKENFNYDKCGECDCFTRSVLSE